MFEPDIWTLRYKKSAKRKCAALSKGVQGFGGKLERGGAGVPSGNAFPSMSVAHPGQQGSKQSERMNKVKLTYHKVDGVSPCGVSDD